MKKHSQDLIKKIGTFFPTLVWIVIFLFLWVLFSQFNPNPEADWEKYYQEPGGLTIYPPWTELIIYPFRLFGARPLIMALNLSVVGWLTYRVNGEISGVIAALTSFPMVVELAHGAFDFLPLLGLVLLPWGIPLTLIKPQVAGWALIARRKWLLWTLLFGLLTLRIWGLWPLNIVGNVGEQSLFDSVFNVSLWSMGWPLGILGLGLFFLTLKKYRDPDQLMCVGVMIFPYVLVNHYLPLLPAMGRIKKGQRWILWAVSWIAVLDGFWGIRFRLSFLLFPLLLWWFLRNTEIPSLWGSAKSEKH